MNAKYLIAAVAVFAAGSAMAEQTYPYVDFTGVQSTRTRAEVIAEMKQVTPAEKQAQNSEYVDFSTAKAAPIGKTRAQVRAELEQAYYAGQYAGNRNTESVDFTNVASTRTREEVRQEALQTARDNQAKGKNFGG